MNIKFNSTHIESGQEYNYNDETEDFDGKPEFNNKEIVLPKNKTYQLKITYPLDTPAVFSIDSGKNGMSRDKLVSLIRKYYKKVYKIEDSSTKIKPGQMKNLMNRNFTNGKFGIWGHDIGDLVLVDATVSKKNVINLGVDS